MTKAPHHTPWTYGYNPYGSVATPWYLDFRGIETIEDCNCEVKNIEATQCRYQIFADNEIRRLKSVGEYNPNNTSIHPDLDRTLYEIKLLDKRLDALEGIRHKLMKEY